MEGGGANCSLKQGLQYLTLPIWSMCYGIRIPQGEPIYILYTVPDTLIVQVPYHNNTPRSDKVLKLGVGFLDGRKMKLFDRDTPYDHVTSLQLQFPVAQGEIWEPNRTLDKSSPQFIKQVNKGVSLIYQLPNFSWLTSIVQGGDSVDSLICAKLPVQLELVSCGVGKLQASVK